MRKFTLRFLFFVSCTLCFSQDPYFTNTNQSLIYLNPSFSGSNGYLRNQTFYRSQWPGSSQNAFVTYGNAFDAYIKPLKGGISFSAVSDDQGNGTLKMTWLNFAYAQYFSLLENKLKIIPSVQIGYIQQTLDKTKLNFGDPINIRYGLIWNYQNNPWGTALPGTNKQNINFSSGLLVRFGDVNAGVSVFNFNSPDIGLYGIYKLPIRTCVYASYNYVPTPRTSVNLSALSNFQMGANRTQVNAISLTGKLILGLGYYFAQGQYLDFYRGRNYYYNGFIATAGIKLKLARICYSYDNTVFVNSGISFQKPSHEISLSFSFKNKKDSIPKFGMENW